MFPPRAYDVNGHVRDSFSCLYREMYSTVAFADHSTRRRSRLGVLFFASAHVGFQILRLLEACHALLRPG